MCRLRRVFESAKHGIPLKIKGDDVKLNFKPNVTYKRCPQPHWGYGAKRNIMTKWARKMLECGMFEHAPDSPWASRPHIAFKTNYLSRDTSRESDVFDTQIVGDYV